MLFLREMYNYGRTDPSFFKVQQKFKKSKVGFIPNFLFSDMETNVGIEVEVESIDSQANVGMSDDANAVLWRNIEDGSLRNGGREFVSIPVSGHNIEFALHSLHDHLHKNKKCARHQFTDRTSVHVHMNMQDANSRQLAAFLITYLMVEPLLYIYG